MPVPPAVSCASDRASAPRLATVQKRRGQPIQRGKLCSVVKGICSRSRVFCGRVFALCGITKRAVFPFAFAWCGRAKSKIRSHGVLFTAGVFPILSIAHSQEGGAVCSVVKGICYCPVRFAAGFLLVAELTKRTVFPVGNGGGVQNSRQKTKSWSKVWANCRNRAQNY